MLRHDLEVRRVIHFPAWAANGTLGVQPVVSPSLNEFPSGVLEKLFEYNDDIRSAMIVDLLGNLISFSSRTKKPVDPVYLKDVSSKSVALMGGILRGSEGEYGVMRWVHLRYNKVHVYCWRIDGGYLVFTSRSQLGDALLDAMGTSGDTRARYADLWVSKQPQRGQ